MDIERLKELREETEQYRAVADDRCMSTQYEDDILALIDAEITELSDEGRFPDEAEKEYNKNFEAKCNKTGINLLTEPSDADVADAIEDFEKIKSNYMRTAKAFDGSRDPIYAESCKSIGRYDLAITALRQYQKPTGETSDGYHTFNELYHHRAILFAALSKAYPDNAWKSLKHYDGTMFGDDWFICGIETPKGQYTYHFNTTYWPLFAGKVLDNAPEWDGHKPEDVERLMSLQGCQKPTDEAVQMAIEDLESGYHRAEMLDDDYIDLPISTETIALAITALRQMGSTDVSTDSTRATGCEWCDKILTLFTNSGKFIPENQPPRNYCPNCGRYIGGDAHD